MAARTVKPTTAPEPPPPTAVEVVVELPPAVELPLPTNVIQAIARVEAEIGGIRKMTAAERARLGIGGGDTERGIQYAYRGIDQLAAAAQPLFGKYGVVFVPTVLNQEIADLIIKGNPWTDTFVEVRYDIYGPGGVTDVVRAEVTGQGRDNSDKGINKAMTTAFKNLLLRLLCIGDPQDDTDGHSPGADNLEPPDPRPAPAPIHPADALFERLLEVGKAHPPVMDELKAWAEGKHGLKRKEFLRDDYRKAVENKLDDLLAALPQTEAEDEPQVARTVEEVAAQLEEQLGATDATEPDTDTSTN